MEEKTPLAIVVPIPKGEWSNTASYNLLNIVVHDGRSYICKSAGAGTEPVPAGNAQWQLIAEKGKSLTFDMLTQEQKDSLAASATAAANEARDYADAVRVLLDSFASSSDEAPSAALVAQVALNKQGVAENKEGLNDLALKMDNYVEQGVVEEEDKSSLFISDTKGNAVAKFSGGDLYTKNFDSRKVSSNNVGGTDLDIADPKGNVVLRLKNGHIKTKEFDSERFVKIGGGLTKLRFLHWNIGHFCGGKDYNPKISTQAELDRHIKAYRSLFNQYSADIVGMCEYSANMATISDSATRSKVMSMYRNALEGKQNGYGCSALFSREGCEFGPINYVELGKYGLYGLYTTFSIGDKDIVICELHTPWQSVAENIEANEVLVNLFRNNEYVILGGDFNTLSDAADSFSMFKDDGYTIANGKFSYMGDVDTYASKLGYGCLDNILVKGGSIVHTEVITDAVIKTLVRGGNMTDYSGAYFSEEEFKIKIGRDCTASDGNIYNLSDHLPIFCDIVF